MRKLDSREEIAKIDIKDVLGSIESLPDQCLHAWQEADKIHIPNNFKSAKNIVMAGMGGSGLGARVIESVFSDSLKIPFHRVHNYNLPAFVNQDSLVICSTYSGNTEEVISTARQAIAKKAKWIAVTTGGELLDLAKKHQVPTYLINPKHNPSNQPRMAIGYSVVGQLVLVSKTEVIKFTQKDVESMTKAMRSVIDNNKVENKESKAKQLANQMKGRIILYISADHLIGAMHTVNNQLNENAKNISVDYQIPELNHHLMEGLKHPAANSGNLIAVLADSDLYAHRIQKRFNITQQVFEKNNINTFVYKTKSSSKLAQAFELIQFGAYSNLYLSILYDQNPAVIPWVDYFKEKLSQ